MDRWMDHLGWQVAVTMFLMIVTALVARLTAPRNDCSKCGLPELKKQIERLCRLIRVLADRVKLTPEEQIEIERME